MLKSVKLSIFLNGELKGVKIVQLPCVIGRSKESSVVISHPLVSRKHCLLCLENGNLKLNDLGSLNGVSFQGRQIIETPLEDHDLFYIGNISFMVEQIEVDTGVFEKPAGPPKNHNGVFEAGPKPPRPVKLAPFPLNASIPPASSTQYIPAPPPSVKSGNSRIAPSEIGSLIDLAAIPPVQDIQLFTQSEDDDDDSVPVELAE